MQLENDFNNEKYKCYIYGAGNLYNKISAVLHLHRHIIEIIGVVTTDEPKMAFLDEYRCFKAIDVDWDKSDLVIIAVENWKSIYDYLQMLGVALEKIIRGQVFLLPHFDFNLYMKLQKSRISILANTCLGGRIYKELGLRALTPTINALCIDEGAYIKFLNNLEFYLNFDMEEYTGERTFVAGTLNNEKFMPCGVIDNDIRWLFPHTDCINAAISKWNTVKSRINLDNLAVTMVIFNDADAKAFEKLPIKKKIGFYYRDLSLKSVIYTPEWDDLRIRHKYNFSYGAFIHRYATNIQSVSRIDWIRFLIGNDDYLRF